MKFGGGLLGFENGIIVAPMGPDIAGPELVAAVANAGGIGLLASPVNNYEKTVKAIRDTKKLTDKPFGAGILLEFENSNTIKAIYDERLPLLQVYWGDFPKERVDEAHRNGVKVIHQVGSVEAAERAIAAGVDCIIAQGLEAGGHIAGTVALIALVPRIVDLVGDRDIPVVAAGSISDAHGYVAALALGAKGICVGTRFIATKEAYANEYYKQQLLHYTEQQTDRTDLYGRLTWRGDVRCLNTPFHEKWRKSPDYDSLVNDDSQPTIGRSTIYSEDVVLRRFAGQAANPTTDGQLENMVMYAGQGVGLVNDIVPAGEVIRRYVDGAKAIIQQLGETYLPESSAPSLTVDREEKEDEGDEDKDRKVRPLVPNDDSTGEPQAVPTPTSAAAEFTKCISSVDPKDGKSEAERDRHGSNESSSHRVQEPKDVDRYCRRDEYKEINAERDRELEHAPDKHTAQVNKNLLVAKQLIEMIPRTKDELFCYEMNWAVYDKHQLHERIRPWISKKVIEFLGEEETTLVDYILSKIKDHVRASELLELLVRIVDDEAEMFVFRLWRIIIFEIKKVEIGIAPKLKA